MTLPVVKKTCMEMMTQRGYTIDDITPETIMATKPNGQKVCLYLKTIQQFNVDKYQEYVSSARTMNIKHIIVIVNKVTSNMQKNIHTSANIDIEIETFTESSLKYNVTKHYLVPQHIIVKPEKARELLDKFGASSYPVLLRTDPIARFYNYCSGSLVKIIRKSGDITYRYVK